MLLESLKAQLEEEGQPTGTPREGLRAAYAAGWLDGEATWLDMLKDRNLTAHVYRESMARSLVTRVPNYLRAMDDAAGTLRARIEAGGGAA